MLMHQVTEDELDVCYNVNVKGTFFRVLKKLSNSFLNNGIYLTYCMTSLTRAFYDDKNFNNLFVESIPL